MIRKRAFAFFIDMFVVTIILNIFALGFASKNRNLYSNELDAVFEQVSKNEITFEQYINRAADISRDIDKENIYINIIQAMILIGYFVVVPYSFGGKTLGKKIFKLKVVSTSGELSYGSLIIRTLLINGLGYLLINMLLVFMLPSVVYLITSLILGFAESIILIICIMKMIKSKENIGLHDKLAKTQVIESI